MAYDDEDDIAPIRTYRDASPQLNQATIEVPAITNLGPSPAETEVVKEDIAIATMQLQGIMAGWSAPGLTVARMLKLVDGTIKAVKHRRDVLGLPYGFIDKGPRNVSFEPLD